MQEESERQFVSMESSMKCFTIETIVNAQRWTLNATLDTKDHLAGYVSLSKIQAKSLLMLLRIAMAIMRFLKVIEKFRETLALEESSTSHFE